MNRLLEIGFELAGHWSIVDGALTLDISRHGNQANVLYAFTVDGEVKYVGKTTQTLKKRLYGYCNPGVSQSTNQRNHRLIREMLERECAVDVLALPDNALMHYGQFHLNLAAGLEDSIISTLKPEWNGMASTHPVERTVDPVEVRGSFQFVLQPTYYSSGFFNVSVDYSDLFASDGEQIDIFCGDLQDSVTGMINRRANKNGTPRIMGGVALREWFQHHEMQLCDVNVKVLTPTEIRLDILKADTLASH